MMLRVMGLMLARVLGIDNGFYRLLEIKRRFDVRYENI